MEYTVCEDLTSRILELFETGGEAISFLNSCVFQANQ